MPYLAREKQVAYQREWVRKRRSDWIASNGPCVWCGSSDRLELDHIDPSQKLSHAIWSWSDKRLEYPETVPEGSSAETLEMVAAYIRSLEEAAEPEVRA